MSAEATSEVEPSSENRSVQAWFSRLVEEVLPDPFVLVIGLTLLAALLALVVEHSSPKTIVDSWGGGLWSLLEFAMQMSLILALGYVLAKTPLVDRAFDRVADRVNRPATAIVVATLVGGVGSWVNWGFGLVIGGLVARKLATRVAGVHYPLIIAAAYSGFTLYGLGLSASIPLTISTAGHPLAKQMGVVSLSKTIFTLPMLSATVAVLVLLPFANALMHPRREGSVVPIHADPDDDLASKTAERKTTARLPRGFAERVNGSRIPTLLLAALGIAYVIIYFVDGGKLDINAVNLILLFGGIALMGTPRAFVAKLTESMGLLGGIILQFPFYAGIMGILGGTGLAATIASWFTSVANAHSLPILGMVSSFVINFFAPSGGGHWVVQGPFMIDAAKSLHSSLPINAMAVQLGNGWNDVIQPFWLLPALAISGMKLKDLMGYLIVDMVLVGIIYSAAILLWAYL